MIDSKFPPVGIRSAADLTGVDRDAVRSAIARAGLKPAGKAGGHPLYSLRELLHALFDRRGDVDPQTLTPQDRRAIAEARLKEFELAKRRGEFVARAEVVQSSATTFAMIASTCRGIPDLLERYAGIPPDQSERAELAIENALDALASAMDELVARGETETGEDTTTD